MCTCGTNVVSMMVASRASTQECSPSKMASSTWSHLKRSSRLSSNRVHLCRISTQMDKSDGFTHTTSHVTGTLQLNKAENGVLHVNKRMKPVVKRKQ